MNDLLAQPETTRKAIRACENRVMFSTPDTKSIAILKGVLETGEPDYAMLIDVKNRSFYGKGA